MSKVTQLPDLGVPDPELRNSPIVEDTDYDLDVLGQELPEQGVCFFNGKQFREGQFISSGSEVLKCENGAWVREGSRDQKNP